MALRQYHTSTGTYMAEPSQEELDREFEMEKSSPMFQRMVKVLAELTGKTEQEVEDCFKKNMKG